ncbi:MAG: hypothetical protein E7447_04735 [Ruminococcaceae bacterium]|nr:hypothetical protein [Oscillospiraceae bacterium]
MTDLHTHILPKMDDGAQSVKEALEMLQAQAEQGVDAVALTPHYYGREESIKDFLARRDAAFKQLSRAAEGKDVPQMILGAEVAWMPNMAEWPELEKLCYQGSNVILVELPMTPWTDATFQQLYKMENRRGVTPMIAHFDRYFQCQKERNIHRLLETGYPIQISAGSLYRFFTRHKPMSMLKYCDGILISDCHNMEDRRPNIGGAMTIVAKKLGNQMAAQLADLTDEILMD